MARANEILEEALALPPDDRARIAARLIESLEADDEAHADEVRRAEVTRRIRELDDGSVETVDWVEARRQILTTSSERIAEAASVAEIQRPVRDAPETSRQ